MEFADLEPACFAATVVRAGCVGSVLPTMKVIEFSHFLLRADATCIRKDARLSIAVG
jgi:hypothetical protein